MGQQIESLEHWQQLISQEYGSAHLRQLEEQGIPYQMRWSGFQHLPTSHPDPRMYSGQMLTYVSDYIKSEFSAQGVDVSGLITYYRECIGNGDPLR